MSQKTNPKLVGLFVLGAFAIALGGIVAFGGSGFFAQQATFVLFFRGSVAGLQVGAPVNFRGVPLGQVTDISVTYFPNDENSEFLIPVYIQVEPDRIRGVTTENTLSPEQLIDLGLRAELALQSFVTGQLGIELDFRPQTPIRLVRLDPDFIEIPTLPSDTEKLRASITRVADILEDVPLEDIATNIQTAVQAASRSVVRVSAAIDDVTTQIVPISEEILFTVREARARLEMEPGEVLFVARQSLAQLQELIDILQNDLGPLSEQAQTTLSQVEQTASDAETLIAAVNSEVAPVSEDLQQTLQTATSAMEDARGVMQSLDARADPLLVEARTALATATEVLNEARAPIVSVGRLAGELETQVAPAAADFRAAMGEARVALEEGALAIGDLRTLIGNVDGGIEPMMSRANGILGEADLAVQDARSAVAGVRSLVSPDAATISQLDAALREIRRAAVSLREFADFVARNPNALLTGRR